MIKMILSITIWGLSGCKSCMAIHTTWQNWMLTAQFAASVVLAIYLWQKDKRRAAAYWLLANAVAFNLWACLTQPTWKEASLLFLVTGSIVVLEILTHQKNEPI